MRGQRLFTALVAAGAGLIGSVSPLPLRADTAPAHLNKVSIDSHGGATHIKLSLSHSVKFHSFELAHPARLVIDMTHANGTHPKVSRDGKAVKAIRFGRHVNGVLRAVFVLKQKELPSVWPSSNKGATVMAILSPEKNQPAHRGSDEAQKHRRRQRKRIAAFQAVQKSGPAVVVIDPGHGGHDPGTTGPHGLHEKTVTLAIGKIVAHKLNETPGVRAYMTRHRDRYVSLVGRVLYAQRHHANVFVSIHENAYNKDPFVDGGTCFALSTHGASDAEAQQLARDENSHDRAVDGVDFKKYGHRLNSVLTDLFQTAAMQAETHLGRDIIHQFGKVEPIYDHKVQRANFAVLRDPLIPSVLCETAFLSNPRQARELHHHHFRAELADAIYKGIMRYLHHYAPMQLAQTTPGRYKVHRGDTLSGIASKFGVAQRLIKHVNHLDSDQLQVGEELTIPGQQNG